MHTPAQKRNAVSLPQRREQMVQKHKGGRDLPGKAQVEMGK